MSYTFDRDYEICYKRKRWKNAYARKLFMLLRKKYDIEY